MPRLLLVDDNPSIHRIAESLLAPTDVEVVCVDSAAEALDRFTRGERFDVALVDTAMPGMDGWALLARLREMEATAHLPIAMMAGVLDPVDPARLAQAPIQGFLKKPIELRELADRVKALLATSPAPSQPPAAALPVPEPAGRTELVIPAVPPMPPPALEEALPALAAIPAPDPFQAAPIGLVEDDLLVLTAEDLWPEEAAAKAAPIPAPVPVAIPAPAPAPAPEPPSVPEVHLDLEELDLDSLHGLATGSIPLAPTALPAAGALPVLESLPPASSAPASEAPVPESLPAFTGVEALDDFGGALELPPLPEPEPPVEAAGPPVLPPPILPVAGAAFTGLAAGAAGLLGGAALPPLPAVEPPVPPVHEPARPAPEAQRPAPPPVVPRPELPPAVPGQAPAAPGQATPLTPAQVQALLADPVAMDALVKALVERMGDQVIREIAWEVLPELAGRLQR